MADDPDFSDLLVAKDEAVHELSDLLERLAPIEPHDWESLERWYDMARNTIEACFASITIKNYFVDNSGFRFSFHIRRGRKFLSANKKRAEGIIKRMIQGVESQSSDSTTVDHPSIFSNQIFIVHGHDNAAREAVARVVSKLGLIPIILHEQPNRGATIIEKFERHSDVGFAIILLTPDDEGRAKGEEKLSERARQNVILEMGYFVGKLGRERVMVLLKGDIEIPSDVIGVMYEPLDDGGAWRFKLGKELQAAGYDVDLNKL